MILQLCQEEDVCISVVSFVILIMKIKHILSYLPGISKMPLLLVFMTKHKDVTK